LGYLCETRAIYTSTGSDMCTFPFTYQGKTYTRYQFYKTFLGLVASYVKNYGNMLKVEKGFYETGQK
jgi:hypothetical protein